MLWVLLKHCEAKWSYERIPVFYRRVSDQASSASNETTIAIPFPELLLCLLLVWVSQRKHKLPIWFFLRCQTGLDWRFFSGMNYICLRACTGSNTAVSETGCWVLLKCKQQINKKVKLVTVPRLLPIDSMTLAGRTLCVQCVKTWLCTVRDVQAFLSPSFTTATFEMQPFRSAEPANQPSCDFQPSLPSPC